MRAGWGGSGAATLIAAAAIAHAAAAPADVDRHIAAAREAAGTEHAAMVDRLCPKSTPPSAAAANNLQELLRNVEQVRASDGKTPATAAPPSAAAPPDPPRERWHAEPQKVFDNLYFVGMTEFASWAVTTTDGIIVIDPLFDYSVEDEVVGGLRTLGLDPANIRYVLISHGHLDHAGGAKRLQQRFGARLLMSAADWDLVERDNPRWKPQRDLVITDGQKLTLGGTTLTMYLTPGHTNGTVSTLIPLTDGGQKHVAALWGGTLFNFAPDAVRFRAYADSAARMRTLAASAGADVLLSNHTDYDGSKTKLPALAKRAPGAPNPYVVGADSVRRYLTVANECAQAALATLP